MRSLFLIIIAFLYITQIKAQDSTNLDSISTINDSLIAQSDSISYIKIITDDSFWITYQGLIGALIGSMLAALIAIYSIKKTHNNQIFLENQKILNNRHIEEKVYCGFLFSIYAILLNHQQISKKLKSELSGFLNYVKSTGDLIIEKTYNRFAIDLMKDCLLKGLSYQNYDSNIVLYLVTYINMLENFDSSLNFIPLLKIKDKHKDIDSYATAVEKYFADLQGLLLSIDELNEKIVETILAYLRNSEVVDMHEYLETLHNQQLKPTA